MNGNPGLFRCEQEAKTLILSPTRDLSELESVSLNDTFREILDRVEANHIMNLVFDFHATDYYGSTALGMFITLWKQVQQAGGEMVFCNLSPHEREILELTRLDQLWTICHTRDDALARLS
jgi:anti-anti-sigma factor